MPPQPVEVVYSYAREDEALRDELVKHLANLRRRGLIANWYDRDISAGKEWEVEIKEHLDKAGIILLLISPDFMDSDYCNDVEVTRAMERHEAGDARVIPVLLRPVDWEGAPFSHLNALPSNGQPVTSWPDRDEAFLDITKGIKKALQELSGASGNVAVSDIPRPPKVGFIPRHYENGDSIVRRLQEELAPHKNQLVALWGAGGVGKTTLTAEAARGLEEVGQRIVWVSADGRANFTLSTLLDDIAEQFGRTDLRPLVLEPKEKAVRALIADAPTLIVLDNFETIPPDEQPPCITFLAEKAHCPALITTRESIDDVRSIPLHSMLAEEGSTLLDRLVEQTSNPGIYTEAIRGRILETAENNPLVIQWIVRQINLANDPEEVLTELALGEGEAAKRVFDRSFNLPQMAEGGRAVLLALSLFMPSATRSALAEVAGMGKDKDKKKFKKAQETLASLWLLTHASGGQRLTIEGLTREFAKARLSHDPRSKTFRQRFVNRFLRYAEVNSKATAEHLNLIEAEKDNILSAMDVALELGDWRSAMRVYSAVYEFLSLRGYWDETIRRGGQLLDIARMSANERWISFLTHNLAVLYHQQGILGVAGRLYAESLEIEKKLGNQSGVAQTLHQLAMLAQDQGDIEEARRLYSESLEITERLNDQSGVAYTFGQLGNLAMDEGDPVEARRLYSDCLEISRKVGDQNSIATTLLQLGSLAQDQGDIEEARRLYNESLEIKKRLGDQSGVASALHQLGTLAQGQGGMEEARHLYDESLKISKRLGDQSGVASTLHQLGRLAEDEGNKAEAARLFREALSILERLRSPNAEIARDSLARVEGESS
ncbi:MAG: tetratricopeptide repeat protein [Acidobacteriota bacterium]|nr:tetratricopeptide repeat protein [Acidobacteriota bacterium]MDQ5838141.1 tetratricopeptide repeat protein [Acidobacteriota bacterium]